MDESLNAVNAAQEQTVDAQTAEPTTETVSESAQAKQTEIAEPSQKKTEQSQEENAKYAAARRKAEAEAAQKIADAERKARDAAISEAAEKMGWNTKDRQVKNWSDFEALKAEAELIENGIDPNVYKQARENDPEYQQLRKEKAERAEKEQKKAQYTEFLKEFKSANNREFDGEKDSELLKSVVAESVKTNRPLADVYAKVHSAELMKRIADLEAQMQAAETNKKNAESSPGSVSTDGSTADPGAEITTEQFEAHRGDRAWMAKNWEKVMKWYKKG